MERRPLRLVLIDDHEMVLHGLKAMLSRYDSRVRIVGHTPEVREAEHMVTTLNPDVVLCDVRLRGASGLDLCRRLLDRQPARRVVFLSVYDDEQYLFQALRAGASGTCSSGWEARNWSAIWSRSPRVRPSSTRHWPGARPPPPPICTAASSGRARAWG